MFKHDSELDNAHAHDPFDRIRVTKKAEADVPRSFGDYTINVDEAALPGGITLIRRVG